MSEHRDENLLKDVTHVDNLGVQSNQNVAELIRLFREYAIDKLRSICIDDPDFDVIVGECSKLLREVVPNFCEWDGTSTLVADTMLPKEIEFEKIKPYMTSKWVKLSKSYLKLYNSPLQDLYDVYSKWLEDRERACDKKQFKRHTKCVSLLKRLVYITETIGYIVDEATVAMKVYDTYKLITKIIKNGVIPPLELVYRILDRHLVPTH